MTTTKMTGTEYVPKLKRSANVGKARPGKEEDNALTVGDLDPRGSTSLALSLNEQIAQECADHRSVCIALNFGVHPDYLYTIKETAKVFSVSERTIKRWVAAGIGPKPVTLPGSTVRFSGMSLLSVVHPDREFSG